MNSENRNKVLIGFGALAVVLIAAIALWPPTFRSEEASGAIGAVQKHRAPQIGQNDVILGDEATRQQQKVLYGDFFSDAQKLQDISAKLATVAMSKGSVAEAANEVNLMTQELMTRYRNTMNLALMAVEAASKHQGNEAANFQAEAAEIAQAVKGEQALSSVEMEKLNAKFLKMTEALHKTSSAIVEADREVAAAFSQVAKDAEAAANTLKLAQAALNDKESANLVAFSDWGENLAQIARNEEALSNVQEALTGNVQYNALLPDAQLLANQADKLQQNAIMNMRQENDALAENAKALKEIDAILGSAHQSGNAVFDQEFAAIKGLVKDQETAYASFVGSVLLSELGELQSFSESKLKYAKFSAPEAASAEQVESAHLYQQISNVEELRNEAANLGKLQNTPLANLMNNAQFFNQVTALNNNLESQHKE